jgi:hypothetical protein
MEEDLEDSLDSLFGSMSGPSSPTKVRTSIADEDKKREARLYRQKEAGGDDVDSLLSELRSARTGVSMSRNAANVVESSSNAAPEQASSTKGSRGKGGRRHGDDALSNSVSRDAAHLLEGNKDALSVRTERSERSRRLGGAAVSWLDSSKDAPVISPGSGRKSLSPSSADASGDEGSFGQIERAAHACVCGCVCLPVRVCSPVRVRVGVCVHVRVGVCLRPHLPPGELATPSVSLPSWPLVVRLPALVILAVRGRGPAAQSTSAAVRHLPAVASHTSHAVLTQTLALGATTPSRVERHRKLSTRRWW